jgi:4'-phosphopantetheinyl transferase
MDQPRANQPSARPPGEEIAAARCEVHVGRIQDLRRAHLALLGAGEIERARQYRLAADTDRVLLGAVLLRLAAARHLGSQPAGLAIDRTCGRCGAQHGRPQLPGSGLHASVSHSGDVVVVALTAAGPVGVDVEAVRAIDFAPVADSVCTPAERGDVRTAAGFYTCWTRKEAVLKATGEGLSRPMTDLQVSPPGAAPVLLRLGSTTLPPCQLADISVGDGYRACVAVLTQERVAVTTLDASALLAAGSSCSQGRAHERGTGD